MKTEMLNSHAILMRRESILPNFCCLSESSPLPEKSTRKRAVIESMISFRFPPHTVSFFPSPPSSPLDQCETTNQTKLILDHLCSHLHDETELVFVGKGSRHDDVVLLIVAHSSAIHRNEIQIQSAINKPEYQRDQPQTSRRSEQSSRAGFEVI